MGAGNFKPARKVDLSSQLRSPLQAELLAAQEKVRRGEEEISRLKNESEAEIARLRLLLRAATSQASHSSSDGDGRPAGETEGDEEDAAGEAAAAFDTFTEAKDDEQVRQTVSVLCLYNRLSASLFVWWETWTNADGSIRTIECRHTA